ncbi:hypothetical protein JI735_14450 [Paenibacillus sonchi]|uniref:Uncharacterized protein n=2 Tax=Paenibacillus sonchi group TaxID=2044880 RepID=A0A974PGH8_9BACL|nr:MULTISPECIES: hypothetical protein [Paenibacillus sonchi group]KWX80394.1 hypothetical protein AMQ84_03900 [Paenibacillus riograndensis]KWX86444.1 hypothetical protein AMQ83_18890 [Paenibacillus riograndensis]QQZ63542.1 hypothetical protein JI735_14450 [Paenibacillus sonchi]
MIIVDEVYHNVVYRLSTEEIRHLIERLKARKEEEIEGIKDKINKYEQKRRAEEAMYQSLSPIRKWFAGHPASHHTAVEYIVHVKDRFKQIDSIKRNIQELDQVLLLLGTHPVTEEIPLSPEIIREIKFIKGMEAL